MFTINPSNSSNSSNPSKTYNKQGQPSQKSQEVQEVQEVQEDGTKLVDCEGVSKEYILHYLVKQFINSKSNSNKFEDITQFIHMFVNIPITKSVLTGMDESKQSLQSLIEYLKLATINKIKQPAWEESLPGYLILLEESFDESFDFLRNVLFLTGNRKGFTDMYLKTDKDKRKMLISTVIWNATLLT